MKHDKCSENTKYIKVDIDVDEIIEYTSDEDEDDTKSLALSITESTLSLKPPLSKKQARNKNFLKKFETEMSVKLQEHV